jgi:hypothetical protein
MNAYLKFEINQWRNKKVKELIRKNQSFKRRKFWKYVRLIYNTCQIIMMWEFEVNAIRNEKAWVKK